MTADQADISGNGPRILTTEPVSPAKFAHIVLRSSRKDELVEFYCRLLNARIAFDSPMLTLLRYDDEHHRIAISAAPGQAEFSPVSRLSHFAFTFDSLGDLLANYVRLRDLGILPGWCINHGGTISAYYFDPDGNMVETQVDTMSMDEADRFLTESPYFAINPVGVDFDPEVMLARYLAGDAISDLYQYGSAPYADPSRRPTLPGMPPYDWRGDRLGEV